jgi:hypothetical protein
MNPLTQSKNTTILPILIALMLGCFALLPAAQAVLPPPDQGYAGQNTAQGDDALFSFNAPASGIIWRLTGRPGTQRAWHTATLLPNGMVLVAAGSGFHSEILRSAELYDPASRTWSFTGSLDYSTYQHTATLLPNGTSCCGGYYNSASAELPTRQGHMDCHGEPYTDVICTRRRCYKTAWSLLQGDIVPAAVR